MKNEWHHTTVLAVRRDGVVAVGSDGQVTLGTTVIKQGAAKVRRLAGGKVLAGFAGSVADALALFTRFEAKLEEYGHNLERAAVELARDWRTDKALRHLEALLITADQRRPCWFRAPARCCRPTTTWWLSDRAAATPWRRPVRSSNTPN